MASQVITAQAERVVKKLPKWFALADTFINKIDRELPKEHVSERDLRIPVLLSTGGRPGYVNPEMGSFGRGSYQDTQVMTTTFFPLRFAVEFPLLAEAATDEEGKSQLNVFKGALKDAIPTFADFMDRLFFNADSTATLAQATAQTTTGGNTVYTCDFSRGVSGLRVGEYYQVYSNDLVTPRASGVGIKLIDVNTDLNTATFNGTIASAAATDKICFEGWGNVASPPGPNGLRTFHSTASSGSLLGLSRSLYSGLLPNMRDASQSLPTFQMGQQMLHKLYKRRAISQGLPKGMVAVMNTNQQANIRRQVQDIANFDLAKGKMNEDIMPKMDMNFTFAGCPAMTHLHAPEDRIDYINLKNWGYAEMRKVTFWTVNGNRFFPLYAADGAPAAGEWFGLYCLKQWYCDNNGGEGLIYNLPAATYN